MRKRSQNKMQEVVSCRREVQWSEIKKRYGITKNGNVVIEKENLEGIKLKTNNTI